MHHALEEGVANESVGCVDSPVSIKWLFNPYNRSWDFCSPVFGGRTT